MIGPGINAPCCWEQQPARDTEVEQGSPSAVQQGMATAACAGMQNGATLLNATVSNATESAASALVNAGGKSIAGILTSNKVSSLARAYIDNAGADPGEAVTGQLSEELLEAGTGAHGDGLTSFGNPDDIRAYVAALADAGADEVMFLIQMGTVPQDACLESIRMIGEHVIPEYQ